MLLFCYVSLSLSYLFRISIETTLEPLLAESSSSLELGKDERTAHHVCAMEQDIPDHNLAGCMQSL